MAADERRTTAAGMDAAVRKAWTEQAAPEPQAMGREIMAKINEAVRGPGSPQACERHPGAVFHCNVCTRDEARRDYQEWVEKTLRAGPSGVATPCAPEEEPIPEDHRMQFKEFYLYQLLFAIIISRLYR